MTQGERIREVRKNLGLTLEKFGEKIGMKKNSVSQLENGKNSVTEQVVKAICREYNVDYMWLTTGEGEMFVETDDDIRIIRRIQRDIKERGRTLDSVIGQYLATVKPMYHQFVEPTKRYADLIVPEGGENEVAIDLLTTKVRSIL